MVSLFFKLTVPQHSIQSKCCSSLFKLFLPFNQEFAVKKTIVDIVEVCDALFTV